MIEDIEKPFLHRLKKIERKKKVPKRVRFNPDFVDPAPLEPWEETLMNRLVSASKTQQSQTAAAESTDNNNNIGDKNNINSHREQGKLVVQINNQQNTKTAPKPPQPSPITPAPTPAVANVPPVTISADVLKRLEPWEVDLLIKLKVKEREKEINSSSPSSPPLAPVVVRKSPSLPSSPIVAIAQADWHEDDEDEDGDDEDSHSHSSSYSSPALTPSSEMTETGTLWNEPTLKQALENKLVDDDKIVGGGGAAAAAINVNDGSEKMTKEAMIVAVKKAIFGVLRRTDDGKKAIPSMKLLLDSKLLNEMIPEDDHKPVEHYEENFYRCVLSARARCSITGFLDYGLKNSNNDNNSNNNSNLENAVLKSLTRPISAPVMRSNHDITIPPLPNNHSNNKDELFVSKAWGTPPSLASEAPI